jgi:hypothetical protein
MAVQAPDFAGYATKAGLKCSDGRTITPQAFQHMDGLTVPLVWQHGHNSPENILGHAILRSRPDGVYAEGFFNGTNWGQAAKALVAHGDIKNLSIYANQLVEKMQQVLHGVICEVSLVLKGANPGAKIDYVAVQHGDGELVELEDEAVIYTNEEFQLEHAADSTMQEIYDSMTDEQKQVLHYMVGVAAEGMSHSGLEDESDVDEDDEDDEDDDTEEGDEADEADAPAETTEGDAPAAEHGTTPAEGDLNHQEGNTTVTRNVFEDAKGTGGEQSERRTLSHSDVRGIISRMERTGSLRSAVEEYALQHNIDNIDVLFPTERNITGQPEFDKRRTEWVAGVLNGTRKSPFSRIKTLSADITQDEARARGYVKGTLKKEEFFGLTKRVTTPTTVYKKQKLDRDDILDITDLDVVAWVKMEMRLMLDEELARAILVGDGRAVDDDDKIKDPAAASDGAGIRSIANDADIYAATVQVNLDDASSSYQEWIDEILLSRRLYKGTGTPTLYTTNYHATKMLLLKDTLGRRLYNNKADLASALGVDSIVEVEVMEQDTTLLGILVNLQDYCVGTDRGGEVSMFDNFDIDYNQYKYLLETRMTGALCKLRSALVYRKVAAGAALVTPVKPGFAANVITPATTTGVTYKRADTNATVTTGAPITLDAVTLTSLVIYAVPASGSYYFENNVEDQWTFNYEA